MMMRPRGARVSGSRRRRGASAVEMALILPLLVTIVLGCVDFGRCLYYHVGVVNAARAGAAYGIMNNYSGSMGTAGTTGKAEMTGMTGLDTSKLSVTVTSSFNSATGLYTITSTATYQFTTIVQWPGLPHIVNMGQQVQMRAIR